MAGAGRNILVVEDDDDKYSDVARVIETVLGNVSLARASTLKDAEKLLQKGTPDLIILDVSMNIAQGGMGPLRGGFANLGGLDLLDRLFYLGESYPTIIVTGFDAFRTPGNSRPDFEIVGLQEIVEIATSRIGSDLIGTVRYQSDKWDEKLIAALRRWLAT